MEGVEIVSYEEDLDRTLMMIHEHEQSAEHIQHELSAEFFRHEQSEYVHTIKEEPRDDEIIFSFDSAENPNNVFVYEEVESPEPIIHPSVGSNKRSFLRKIKQLKICFLCSNPVEFKFSNHLKEHFEKQHMDRVVKCFGNYIVKCKLGCRKEPHYHCPLPDCLFSCSFAKRILPHFKLNHMQLSIDLKSEPKFDDLPIKQEILGEEYDVTIGENVLSQIFEDSNVEVTEIVSERSPTHAESNDLNRSKFAPGRLSIGTDRESLMAKVKYPYCFLCPGVTFATHFRLKRHFTMLHLNHSFELGGKIVTLCRHPCSQMLLGHYHCPHPDCPATVKVKSRMITHYKKHEMAKNKAEKKESEMKRPKRRDSRVFLPQPKRTFPFDGFPYNEHISIGLNAQDLFDKLCLPFCFLCADRKPYTSMSRLSRHFRMAHLNRAVDCGSCYLVLCGQACLGFDGNSMVKKHYHCPYCNLMDQRRCAFWIHLENHRREAGLINEISSKQEMDQNIILDTNVSNGTATHIMPDGTALNVPIETPQRQKAVHLEPWSEAYQGVPVQRLPAISNSLEDSLDMVSLPNCYLCNDDKDYISEKRLTAHATRCHLKPALQLGHIYVLLCKRYCGHKHKDNGHYHCLFCEFCCRQKLRLKVHVEKHLRMKQKKAETAEYHLPQQMQDHSLPQYWINKGHEEEVRAWEEEFNNFITINYDKRVKTNNNIMTERKKWLIFNHTRHGMDIEDKSLKYWTRFRGVKVIDCDQLDMRNELVMPLIKYNNDSQNRVVDVQADPLPKNTFHLVLNETKPLDEFRRCFRVIPTKEKLFKILYKMHIIDHNHPNPKTMFGEVRKHYLYLPRTVVNKFVAMCPECRNQYPEVIEPKRPILDHTNSESTNTAALQVCVIDMRAHNDNGYKYLIEVQDKCSMLTWLIPEPSYSTDVIGKDIVIKICSMIGLPRTIVTNISPQFTGGLIQAIQSNWGGDCTDLMRYSSNLRSHSDVQPNSFLMNALNGIVTQSTSWTKLVQHIQFRMNHCRPSQLLDSSLPMGAVDSSAFENIFGRQRTSKPLIHNHYSNSTHPTQHERYSEEEVAEF